MRAYLTFTNLKHAAAIGAMASIMAIPRIIDAGNGALSLVFMAFPAMTLVAGAATAWGKYAGMKGPFPEKGLAWRGVAVALVVGLLVAPVLLPFDFDLKMAMAAGFKVRKVTMEYPATVSGCLALMLWSAGFETVFFRAGAMAFFARVTRLQTLAIIGSVSLRAFVSLMMIRPGDLGEAMVARLIGITALNIISCVLYARAGLPAAMTFSAALESRHLLRLFIEHGVG